MAGKKKLLKGVIWILFLGCSCSKSIYFDTSPTPDINEVMKREISNVLKIEEPENRKFSSGYFLRLELPGIPFNMSDLAFSSLPNILVNQETINQAYRFSRLTNYIMKQTDSLWVKSLGSLEANLLDSHIINRDMDLISSALYNEDFFPVYPNPAISDSNQVWSNLKISEFTEDSIMLSNNYKHFLITKYDLSMSIARIGVERGEKLNTLKKQERKIAVIKEIILGKSIAVSIYKPIIISGRRKFKIINKVSSTLTIDSPQIIGYIYHIL